MLVLKHLVEKLSPGCFSMHNRRFLVAILAHIIRENRQALSLTKLDTPNLKNVVNIDALTGIQTFLAELIGALGKPQTPQDSFFELICFPEEFINRRKRDNRLNLFAADSAYLQDPKFPKFVVSA